jgi:RNA polymerase sigma-70 factor (TIGR02960 family)
MARRGRWKDGAVTAELIGRVKAGDEQAFRQLIGPYQGELQLHCYRILGSAQDAEDALQETLLAAWRGLAGFEGRSSVRTWLYRVATNCCLKALRSASRRPPVDWPPPGADPPEPNGASEVIWLQPYPDILLEGLADATPGPEARYEAAEAISLAFVAALQALPPRQRAVLILRDVLGFPTRQVADILDGSEDSAASALKRARATMRHRFPAATTRQPPPRPDSPEERDLVDRFTRAYQAGDVAAVVALLTEDVFVTMPPLGLEYHGRDLVARFLASTGLRPGRRSRLIPTRANGQPAFGLYVQDPQTGISRAAGLLVLTLAGDKVCAMTGFDNSVPPHFGLPRNLPR